LEALGAEFRPSTGEVAGPPNCGWVGSGDDAGAAGPMAAPGLVVDFYNGSWHTGPSIVLIRPDTAHSAASDH
jgi:hypothetical protein